MYYYEFKRGDVYDEEHYLVASDRQLDGEAWRLAFERAAYTADTPRGPHGHVSPTTPWAFSVDEILDRLTEQGFTRVEPLHEVSYDLL